MTNHTKPANLPQLKNLTDLPDDIFVDIAEALSFAQHKSFFECMFQTDGGINVSIKELCDGNRSAYPQTYSITILDSEDGETLHAFFEKTVPVTALFTMGRLWDEYRDIDAKRRAVDTQIEKLNSEEEDICCHVVACTRALLSGAEG